MTKDSMTELKTIVEKVSAKIGSGISGQLQKINFANSTDHQ